MRWDLGLQKLRGLEVEEAIRRELDAADGFQAGDSLIQQAKQTRGTAGVNRCANGFWWCDIRGPRHLRQQQGGTRRDDKERDEVPFQMSVGRGGNVGRCVHCTVQQNVWSPPEGVRP